MASLCKLNYIILRQKTGRDFSVMIVYRMIAKTAVFLLCFICKYMVILRSGKQYPAGEAVGFSHGAGKLSG